MLQGASDARRQPLNFLITTAGNDMESIGYEIHQKAKDILAGRKQDVTFYPTIYAADPEDDWTKQMQRERVKGGKLRLVAIKNDKQRRITPPDTVFSLLRKHHGIQAEKRLLNGDDIKTVQEALGHHTAAFTLDVYGHVTDKMKRDSADRMEQFIKGISNL